LPEEKTPLEKQCAERKEAKIARRKAGRPTKAQIAAKRKGTRGKIGRPKGDKGIMDDYKARMLASPKSEKVMAKMFEIALDDEHKQQGAMIKLVIDRIANISHFASDSNQAKVGAITVNITGVNDVSMSTEDYIDHE
jgi:hypothetical protein